MDEREREASSVIIFFILAIVAGVIYFLFFDEKPLAPNKEDPRINQALTKLEGAINVICQCSSDNKECIDNAQKKRMVITNNIRQLKKESGGFTQQQILRAKTLQKRMDTCHMI